MEFRAMTKNNERPASTRTALTSRRLVLLASVAGLGISVLLGGPGVPNPHFAGFSAPAQAADAIQHPAGFADLVAKVQPAVISVRVKMDGANARNESSPLPPFDRFFGPFGRQNGPDARPRMVTGLGSGFFISSDGYAVTNNHVVEHAKSVEVTTNDGKTYTAKVVGTDRKTDLALIKVDGSGFPVVGFATKTPRVGDWVVAVGNPYGLGGTVTAGIVSARGRDIGAGPYDDFLQIDAPINKGNSGGPAFDVDGNVIGVNTAIFSPSGGSVGIGFVIPADTVKTVVAQLKDNGHVTRGFIGVEIQKITPEIAESLGLKSTEGALVAQPRPNSPAAKAGIEAGDVLTAVNDRPVKDAHELARAIAAMAPGTSLKLTLLRNHEQKSLTVTLGELPNQQQARAETDNGRSSAPDAGRLGLSLAPAASMGEGSSGVVVTGVDPHGPAAEHGVRPGDVILDIAGKQVSSPAEVRAALADARSTHKHTVLMRLKSAEGTRFVAIPIGNA
jgi:serine protease Do